MQRDRLVERLERNHVQDRREGLVLHDGHVVARAHDRRLDEVARARQRAAAAQHLAALLAGVVERGLVLAHGRGADQRAHQRLRVERVADPHLLVARDQPALDLVDARCVDQQAAGRRAALAGGADRAEEHRGHHQVEVGELVDDDGVVAAELEQAAAEAGGDALADVPADLRRAR